MITEIRIWDIINTRIGLRCPLYIDLIKVKEIGWVEKFMEVERIIEGI